MGAGGTSGGVGAFFGGAAMVVAGGYLLLTRVSVVSGGFLVYGYNAFGLSLVPLLAGIGMLFYDGRSVAGWLLAAAGTGGMGNALALVKRFETTVRAQYGVPL